MSRSPIARIVILYVLAAASVACRYEAPPAEAKHPQLQTRTVWQRTDLTGKQVKEKVILRPDVLSRCEAGSQLGPDGLVSLPSDTFRAADPIHLSMWIKEAPEGLQLAMRVLDAEDNEIGIAHRDDAGGAKAITMNVGEKLAPGKYKLEGYWGGNLVCEKAIEVTR
jgi:hypothetical protein